MGEYYRFVNRTRREESQISLPFNFTLPYAKSLEHHDPKEVAAMFRFVVKHNDGWSPTDDLVAIGDYGRVIAYADVETSNSGYGWETYQPKPVPPRKLEPDEAA